MLIRTYSRIKKSASNSSDSLASTSTSKNASFGDLLSASGDSDCIPKASSVSTSFLRPEDISSEFDRFLNDDSMHKSDDENDSFTLSLYDDDSNQEPPANPSKPIDESQKTMDEFVTKTPVSKRTKSFQDNGTPTKKGKKTTQQQLFLDMGQEGLGSITCPTCGMVFTKGTEDEKIHKEYHKKYERPAPPPKSKVLLKYGETIASFDSDGSKIVVARQSDISNGCKSFKDSISAVVNRVNSDLCFHVEGGSVLGASSAAAFVYLDGENRAVGCVIAERIDTAHPVVPKKDPDDSEIKCSKESAKAVVGVSRVWVHPEFRRRGIAGKILDAVRDNFLYGYRVPMNEIAFSQPTNDGYKLFLSYTKTDKFLVYM